MMSNISAYTHCYICMSAYSGGKFRHIRKERGKCCLRLRFLFQTVCRQCHIHTRSFPALPYRSPTKEHRDRYTDKGTLYLHCYCSIFLQLCQDGRKNNLRSHRCRKCLMSVFRCSEHKYLSKEAYFRRKLKADFRIRHRYDCTLHKPCRCRFRHTS